MTQNRQLTAAALLAAGAIGFVWPAAATRYRVSSSEAAAARLMPNLIGSIRHCDAAQTSLIRTVEERTTARVAALANELPTRDLGYVRANFIVPEGRQFSDTAPQNARYTRYLGIIGTVAAKMRDSTLAGVNFECKDDAREARCRGGEVEAYVLASFSGRSYPMIYLCSSFFRRGTTNVDGAVQTTLHELSHYAADTEDYGGDWWNARDPNLERGAMDAYHLQEFALRETDSTLRRNIWFWLWPARPEPTL